MKSPAMHQKPEISDDPVKLRRRAEARLSEQRKGPRSHAGEEKSEADTQRLFHELQVHQIELEMQNAELQNARNELERTLEKYTDLYDFAPVGYFSLDESGVILEANLTSAVLLGVARSRLVNRRLLLFMSSTSRPVFLAFLEKVFTGPEKRDCEALLLKEGGGTFWASFQATSAVSLKETGKWCRVAFGDISARKQVEEAQRRMEALGVANEKLRLEIVRRQTVEESLKRSEEHTRKLLDQSQHMQEQLRRLSRQILSAQEEERKQISRELHDVIAQTLTGINVRLAALKKEAAINTNTLDRNIARTQRLVEKSVEVVHQFARELRPAVLDDLGLIPALHSFMKSFTARTGVRTHLTAFAEVEKLDIARRTVLYRVAQEALTNVARHAKASRAEVSIQKLDGAARMEIKDDGKSFQVERILHDNGNKRLGLLGMRERVEMVGGAFAVESAPGQGTTVRVEMPFARVPEDALKNPEKTLNNS